MLQNIIDEIYRPSCGFSYRNVQKWVERVEQAAGRAGLTICDLKPLAELLGCDSDVDMDIILTVVRHDKTESIPKYKTMRQISKALNWERTEFDTLDELLEEIRNTPSNVELVDNIEAQNELLATVREKLRALAKLSAGRAQRPLIDELLDMLDPRNGGHIPARTPMRVVDVKNGLSPTYNFPCSLKHYMPLPATHTLLHAGELYRDVTILLHTEQLVAWRTADGQEYSAKAHRVTLDPDEDGLAAAILSRIAGVEIAPEHMTELRAQMAGCVK